MTTPADLVAQADVLEEAAQQSNMGVYIGLLRSRAKELRATAKAADEAEGEGWTYDLMPASALESGIPIWHKGVGVLEVRRVSRGGLGVECENNSGWGEPITWINPLAPTSLVVVLGVLDVDHLADVEIDSDPGDDVLNDHASYGLSQT